MAKFNLKKEAKKNEYKNYNKMIEDNSITTPDVSKENINLNIDKKEKDTTVPFEKQLEASRFDKKDSVITEKSLNDSEKMYNDKRQDKWDSSVSPINIETQKHVNKKEEDYKKAEGIIDKDTSFWDKYLGVQDNGPTKKIESGEPKSQLHNNPDRFKNIDNASKAKIEKMVMASLKDADAMLFHLFATSAHENREMTKKEKQIVAKINNEKIKILAGYPVSKYDYLQTGVEDNPKNNVLNDEFFNNNDNYDDNNDTIIRINNDGEAIVYERGEFVEAFRSIQDAKLRYPFAKVENQNDINNTNESYPFSFAQTKNNGKNK